MPIKKSRKLTVYLMSKIRDCFGVWEVEVVINGKPYTYPLSSAFAVSAFEDLLYKKKPGKALQVLKKFKIEEELIDV
jgi:hypothetical protein